MYKMVKITNNNIGDFFMKKWLMVIVIIVIILMFIPQDKEMRIRIIANSDSAFDQAFKTMVAEDMKEFLKTTRDLNIIEERVAYLISKYQVNYDVKVTIRKEKFSAKYLGEKLIPGGRYKTLVIELGEAQGKNYWSLLYPEYFNVSFDNVNNGEVEYRFWLYDLIKGETK